MLGHVTVREDEDEGNMKPHHVNLTLPAHTHTQTHTNKLSNTRIRSVDFFFETFFLIFGISYQLKQV